jgi:hypothetical protein
VSADAAWRRVDRTLDEVRARLVDADTEEQFQAVGLLCRDALISLAQAVYDPVRHPPLDGTTPSATDAKRLLEAFIAVELRGGSEEAARGHARASLRLANDLTHDRTATLRDAALCVEATTSVINVVAIIAEQGARRQGEPVSDLVTQREVRSLSDAARELLREAASDPTGSIISLRMMGGDFIKTNGKVFSGGDVRSAARARSALQELLERRLIEDRSYKGEVFEVTDAGYRLADRMLVARPSPAEIVLKPLPPESFENLLMSGYSNGMPSTWTIVVGFMARNEGARSGLLTSFTAETEEYLPRRPQAFDVAVGRLERLNEGRPSEPLSPVALPLILPADGREKLGARVVLTFTDLDPAHLAADLRELLGVRVKYVYAAGPDDAPREGTGSVELSFERLKHGLISYWLGTNAWRHLAEVVRS